MTTHKIVSKSDSFFHIMIPVFLFLFSIPAFASGKIILGLGLLVLTFLTWYLDKKLQVNLEEMSVKNGAFDTWTKLKPHGYISIFLETQSTMVRATSQVTMVNTKDLRLNYIVDRKKTHIYSAKNMKDAEEVALKIANAWGIGVYNAQNKEWIKEEE